MKKIQIYESASCCSKDNCSNNSSELLRITEIIEKLEAVNIHIERFNLSSSPMEFVNNKVVHQLLYKEGVSKLPLTVIDNIIVVTSRYPSNDEIISMLNIQLL